MEHEHDNHKHSEQSHHKMMISDFKRRFIISTIITIPVLLLSPMIQGFLGIELTFRFAGYILFGLSTFVYFYGGWPFLTGLTKELRKKQPGMMTLIAVAITVAWGYSSATTFGLKGDSFYWELVTLIDIMLLGHWIEMKSVLKASGSLQKLIEMMPSSAHVVRDGNIEEVGIDDIVEGDVVLVKPGEKIPVDGTIIEGESLVNESMVTGESVPLQKGIDDEVIGGTVNGNGSLRIKTKQAGEDAYLNKVVELVREAQREKSKSQNMADRVAFWLTITALTVGFGTLAVWLIIGQTFVFALERMATVMVIACPHALGLAIPLVVAISTSISAKTGLLIRNRTAFENTRNITLVAFDKTGTLTKGNFALTRHASLTNNLDDGEILRLAGAIEARSEHPLADAVMKKVKEESIDIPDSTDFKAISGKGIVGKVEGKAVKILSPKALHEEGFEAPDEAFRNEGETVVFIVVDNELAGFLAMADEIREESYDAVKTLKKHGLKLIMMTGDNEEVAKAVSEKLGLDGFFAGILPDEKLRKIEDFQKDGEFVAMIGDGINDAPALAKADIGIAIGSGTDVAAETADIILVESDPRDIARMIIFGKETYKKMIQNFVWATGYNVVAIPLAAGVLFSYGIVINPALGAVLMSLSTIIVAINAQLLRRKMGKVRGE
ncbi:MAG TPA: cadmium-translocating P-type ATPase [candidate division Zixibacteria bacterium]|nr:cadmium-translocating P-type ATPase [candidate division Zixibacteria bacterium]